MSQFLIALGALVCVVIVFACICRVNLLHYGSSRLIWIAIYSLDAVFAGGMLIDLLTCPDKVDWWTCFGIAGLVLQLLLTRDHWTMGAPVYTEIHS